MGSGNLELVITAWRDGAIDTRSETADMAPESKPRELQAINLHPRLRYQEFTGFGAAFTESSGSVLNRLPRKRADSLIADYYGETGLGYVWARAPIDSCDFSFGMYSACRPGPDGPTLDIASFKEHEMAYIIPWLREADDAVRKRGLGRLRLCLVPWSPPAYMKSNGSRTGGGELLPEHRLDWASYLCLYARAFEAEGLSVDFLGAQNKPNAVQTWDSCRYSPEQERDFLARYLGPELKRRGLGHIGLSAWDHNREGLYERIEAVCRDAPEGLVSAAAFHWYSGDHFEALELVRKAYPELLLLFTEGCIEYSRENEADQFAHARRYARNIIGDLNHGANAWIDWNLALDAGGGPNHVGNFCASPIMLTKDGASYERRLSYYYIGHFSRYIVPGSERIGMSCYTEGLACTAWRRPDGLVVAVVMNKGSEDRTAALRCEGRMHEASIPGNGIVTFLHYPD